MSEIGKLIQAYQDKHGTSDRALALRVGVTATIIGRWKRGAFVELPKPEKIRAMAELMSPRPTEEQILDAFLADTGYKREDVMGNAEHPAPTNDSTRAGGVAGGKVTKLSDRGSNLDRSEPRVAKKRPPGKRPD